MGPAPAVIRTRFWLSPTLTLVGYKVRAQPARMAMRGASRWLYKSHCITQQEIPQQPISP
ncbi:hypothetical protein HPP92_026689 [Vanilla planifolia]|uniref:Uncharacterized protein n=1 Tax=Vanilla planifolia TaxID=51239 RepID=A0A835PHS4_VANPL|nr:hypothetical protein HPP92_026689 [Vanilla planifolia]